MGSDGLQLVIKHKSNEMKNKRIMGLFSLALIKREAQSLRHYQRLI